jgi:uncharacterized cupin superfamily protein
MPNLFQPEFDSEAERPGFTYRRARLGRQGEVVALPIGERGAHQVVNRTSEPVRVLLVSEMGGPDVVVRPESGKLSAFGGAPGAREEGMHEVFFLRDAVEFWEGEEPPAE